MRGPSIALAAVIWLALTPGAAAGQSTPDRPVSVRAEDDGTTRVILATRDVRETGRALAALGIVRGRALPGASAYAADVPNNLLDALDRLPGVASVRPDRPVAGAMERIPQTVGADWVAEQLGFDGSGVGVAIVDSGVADWHDDLGSARVVHFADFVTDLPIAHDDYGHGTHVAGTIAGDGYDSGGLRRGIAPGAHLVVLKVLDHEGHGHISDVIAAIDYAIAQRERFNIRVLNLSVAAGVFESYLTDPLTLAARRAVEAGIVVVTSAGNLGRTPKGLPQIGAITSPGNAPWVITVGASDQQRTPTRADDTIAPFSSRGPTHIDGALKPDLVAPGVAIASLAAPGSTIYTQNPDARIKGSLETAFAPYISLSGTSMAAPVVTGTIALMLEANPRLTPNLVKAILQYTAERRPRFEAAAQGAGLLNARGAVQLAVAMAGGTPGPSDPTRWSRQIFWGNRAWRGGILLATASAWRTDVVWGADATPDGQRIEWGRIADADLPWGLTPRQEEPAAEYPLDITWGVSAQDMVWGSVRR